MKKKPLKKFKPLQELYNHANNTLFNSKSFNSLKSSSALKDKPMSQNVLTWSTLEHQVQDVVECRGDDISCISKEDGEITASVSSPCPDRLDKALNGESIKNGSVVDHMSVEEGDNNSMRAHLSEAILSTEGLCDGLNSNLPITSLHKPPLQNQNVMQEDGPEELVDVRVCDICGDAGREALLAICSKCSDGAEHIYCMTPKLDSVPENGWLCEDCLLIHEPKRRQQAIVERLDNALKPSCSKKRSQGSPSIYTAPKQVGKMSKNHTSRSSGLSGNRLGSSQDGIIKPKKRTIDHRVQLPKNSGSGRQTKLTRVSKLKNMEKRKGSAHQVPSFVDLSAKKVVKQAGPSHHGLPKHEQKSCRGNNLEIQCSQADIHQRRSSSKENAACEPRHPDRMVVKSRSSTSVDPISMDVANIHSAEKFSEENRTSDLRQKRVVSKVFRRAKFSRKNVEDKNGIQGDGNTYVNTLGAIATEGKKCMNSLVSGTKSFEETKSPCNSSHVKDDAYADQGVSFFTQKAKIDDTDQSHTAVPCSSQDLKVMPTLVPTDLDLTVPSAAYIVPESRSIWKGTFKVDKSGKLSSDCYGVQAHLSTHASSMVDELVRNFATELHFKEVPRVHTWPLQFQKNHLTEQDIALYFFAQDLLSYQKSYSKLLEGMTNNDLALEANFGSYQLLVFPSNLLPVKLQRWNSLPYLWGFFRVRKLDDFCFRNLDVPTVNQHLGSPITYRSESKVVSPSVSGSVFASHILNKSMEGEEFFVPGVLQSSASMKSKEQSREREVPSQEEYALKEHQLHAGNNVFFDEWRTKAFDGGLTSADLQRGRRFSDADVMSINNADIFICGNSMTPYGISSDVASGSSLSLDSGPSGLTDSGWCAKSAEEEPFENPASYNNSPNLDLCLWNESGLEDVNLDLTLGFPRRGAYKPKAYLKNDSNEDGNISLVLSLGMPCSNW